MAALEQSDPCQAGIRTLTEKLTSERLGSRAFIPLTFYGLKTGGFGLYNM